MKNPTKDCSPSETVPCINLYEAKNALSFKNPSRTIKELFIPSLNRRAVSGGVCRRSAPRRRVHGGDDEEFGPQSHCGHDPQPQEQRVRATASPKVRGRALGRNSFSTIISRAEGGCDVFKKQREHNSRAALQYCF